MKILITIILIPIILGAANIDGSLSTGFYFGSPYWNSESYDDAILESQGESLLRDESFYRSVNRLKLNGAFGERFRIKMNVLRSDGFQSENRLEENKFYETYGQYDFSGGYVKAGRFAPLNRWIWGSVDGGAVSFSTDRFSFMALGGTGVRYGLLYDSDHNDPLGYAHVGYRLGRAGVKVKAYSDEDATKAGSDFFGRLGKLRYSGNYGYDFTNERLADGGLNLFYTLNRKLSFSANYRMFRMEERMFSFTNFPSYIIERFLVGARYKIAASWYIDVQQMAAMTTSRTDFVSILTLNSRYVNAGVNYLSSEGDRERWSLNLGGRYEPIENMELSAGVTPVNYLYRNMDDHIMTIAYYLKVRYRFLSRFALSANVNFYQDNEALNAGSRGGIVVQYNFGS